MDIVYKKARAKVNLTLNVTGQRDDGYHNIQSVFQMISLYDELWVEKTDGSGIEIVCDHPGLCGEGNIIHKAYGLMRQRYPQIKGVKVTLNKKIPMQAGLGGGSSDCADFLVALNELYHLNLCQRELVRLGEGLGADVPPCLNTGAVLGEGIGEKVTPIAAGMKCYFVIIKPEASFSTQKMYQRIDQKAGVVQPNHTGQMIQALKSRNLQKLCANLYNVFEEVLDKDSVVFQIQSELSGLGALGTLMAGSGSCIFGIFESKASAGYAYGRLRQRHQAYIAVSYNQSRRKAGIIKAAHTRGRSS